MISKPILLVFPKVISFPTRDIEQLLPTPRQAAKLALAECIKRGIEVFLTQTYRSGAYQHGLFITKASELDQGHSMHEYRLALDIATKKLDKNGKPYDIPTLEAASAFFKSHGYIWGGDWSGSSKDRPHFQYITVAEQPKIRTLKTPEAIEDYLRKRGK